MPLGLSFGSPDACPASCSNPSKIDATKTGAFSNSHQKKPVNIINLMNSAKNSPMSARRSAIMPNVQTMLIVARAQNKNVA